MPITKKQAQLLVYIVQEGKREGGLVPTDHTLANLIYGRKLEPKDSRIKAVGDMRRRIVKNYPWAFREKISDNEKHPQRPWHVNEDVLITESSTAFYLVTLHRLCDSATETSVCRSELDQACMQDDKFTFRKDSASLKRVFALMKTAGFLEDLKTLPGTPLRFTDRTYDLLEYLKLLSSAKKNDPI